MPSGMEAGFRAALVADENGCIQAKTAAGATVTVVWPLGYSVRGNADSFEVLDREKTVVARSGVTLAIGGGGADEFQDSWTERACATDGQIWMVGTVRSF